MKITLGINHFDDNRGVRTPVVMDTARLINGHALLVGASGVGKSHTIRRMIAQGVASSPATRFHVFDVHGDLDVPGASEIIFSRHSAAGLNPLRVNPDMHFGGVDHCIETFIRVVNDASPTKLGVKQVSVLRNLLLDVYREFGFDAKDPSTWSLNAYESRLISGGADNRLYLQVPFEKKDIAQKNGARWDPGRKLWYIHTHLYKGDIRQFPAAFKSRTYPTLEDVIEYAKRLHLERFLGSDQKAVRALHGVEKAARTLQRRILESVKRARYDEIVYDEDEEMALDLARQNAVGAYTDYVNAIKTGEELDSLLKYDSSDVMKSVIDRLQTLHATGLFKRDAAPFDEAARVWCYKVNALSAEGKKMFVYFKLQELFEAAAERGQQTDVLDVVVLDELGTYTSGKDRDGGDGIIGVICREARKFGLALWGATQSPATVPEALVSSVAAKIILGIDEMYWTQAMDKLRVDKGLLEFIRAKATIGVQLKEAGSTRNRWWWVKLENGQTRRAA